MEITTHFNAVNEKKILYCLIVRLYFSSLFHTAERIASVFPSAVRFQLLPYIAMPALNNIRLGYNIYRVFHNTWNSLQQSEGI